jgi:PAS domain S-box-containing protein
LEDKINILLIEDNPADSELVSIFLKGVYAGKSTLATADSLTKGIELAERTEFDVIILDLTLPDSWGFETFSKLHTKIPDVPIIVLTGLEDERMGVEAMKLGAQDFLTKGKIKGRDLQRSINYSIERHKLIQSLAEKTKLLFSEKQKLAEAQKLAHMGSWEADVVTRKVTWSDELFSIHGIEPQRVELSESILSSFVHPDDKGFVLTVLDEIFNKRKPRTFTYRIIRTDGNVRVLSCRGEVVTNDKGEITKVVGTAQDITEKAQEEEMEKLSTAATKSYNSVVITDEHGKIEWVNEGFTKLTGYTLEEVRGSHGELLRHGRDTGISEGTNYLKIVLEKKEPITYEYKNFTKNGDEYWTITTLTPVLGDNGKVKRIIAIDSDITMRKKMEEDLVRANKIAEHSLMKGNIALEELMRAKSELEESMRVKEQFMANMSHEIRTPMNAIVGFTELITKTPITPEQKQYIDAIKTSGENLIVIINDILDFSKIESGKIALEQIEFSVSEVLSTLTELMLPKSVEKNITLSKSIDKRIPDRLLGDPTRLNQVLINLVGNAIKFTQKGEVKVAVELISDNADLVNLRFSVSDTGIGIPQDKLPTIFEAFTQAAYDTTRKYGGTGLGLAIVKQLIELQGGDVSVKSELGKGSVFTFTIVYRKNLSPEVAKKPVQDASETGEFKDLKVLLVEDNALNQLLAKKVLSDWGWKVDVAENGLIATEKAEKGDADVILMDIQLPEMDGYEATRYIRSKLQPPKSTVPIIAMTAHAISGEEEKCFQAGMDGYISKPFNPQKLYLKVASVLNTRGGKVIPVKESIKTTTATNGNHKHIDLTYLKKLANGSNDFIAQMLTLFIEQTPEAIGKLEKHLQEHNWDALSKVAHKMKPSVMFVGLKEIEKDIKSVEDYASEVSHTEELPGMIAHIKTVCNEALDELRAEIEHLT